MSGVDDRVVSMQFDNVAFERNLADTLRSLDKLRQSLDFANSTRGMSELSAASKNFNMNEMGNAVDGIGTKFLALTTIGITALATLTTHAITAGASIVKGLSLQPVLDGFKEYETNINSIQTILANTDSKGTTLTQVNAALDQLNTYADQTIYNFSEMTRNIGTFTAAGVGLDQSVQSIKGIANLAAISGSNSEQASTAMYQLSQALASGTVKLMDWNSVVNAGMGGEVFQKALFETGKSLKTIKDVPMSQTFEQWKNAGNSFRGSLQDGWITAEVLTNTLAGFTGDLTNAQILSMGYTQDQATEIMRLGKIGKAAATEVKTFTQLIGTVKEAVGSGWSSSFRLIIGDFNEAKKLFTGISTSIGNVVSASADARNKMLSEWKALGGRDVLLQGFEDAFATLGSVIGPIISAFREIFPATTGQRLFELTQMLTNFINGLRLTNEASDNIRRTFAGLFAVLQIGWTVFKELVGLIFDIVRSLSGAGSGVLGFTGNIGDLLVSLNKTLVAGGGIHRFFERLGEVVQVPIQFIKQLTNTIVGFFTGIKDSSGVEQSIDRVTSRLDYLRGVFDRLTTVSPGLQKFFDGIRQIFDGIFDYIKTWFSELGAKLAQAFHPGDFNAAVDLVNVGLLGGIIALLKKFMDGGLKLDFGGGIFEKVGKSLDGLTGTLKAMQANVKSETLMRIAIAVGVLTASVVVLSLIDSVALTKALTAMSVGFAQMIGAMALLGKASSGSMDAVKLGILAASLILLASSMVVLSLAIKILSTMGWEELTKGLIGISVGLGLMIAAINLMPTGPGMIAAGLAMLAISAALLHLSVAVKSFAAMSWGELVKGLVGVAGGLVIIAAAMWLMPPGMALIGVGLIAVSTGLLILSKAVSSFSGLSWSEMGKGLLGIGAALVIIAGAMWLMPPNMVLTSLGLIQVALALGIMGKAIKAMGEMKMGEIAKGLGTLAVMLGILAAAMIVMTGTAAGAAALLVASAALLVLSGVLKVLGGMSIAQIVTGLAALAGVFIILGAAALILTPLVPTLLGLGAALALMGGAMALFGVGAFLTAKAFEALAAAGVAGVGALIEIIKRLIAALPEFVVALIKSLVDSASELVAAAPLFLRLVEALLIQILDTVINVTPKIGEAFGVIISTGLTIIREKFPEFLTTGFELLMTLLRGIRDNIGEVTTLGVDIVVNFATALTDNAEKIVDSAIKLLVAFLKAFTDRINEVIDAGLNLLVKFLLGISDNLSKVVSAAGEVVVSFVTEVGANATKLVNAGTDALINFVTGIGNNLIKVSNAATDIIVKFISGIDDNALKIINAAADMIINFMNGIADTIRNKSGEFRDAGWNIATAIIDGMTGGLASMAGRVANKAVEVAKGAVHAVTNFLGISSPSKVFMEIGRRVAQGLSIAFEKDTTVENSAVDHAGRIIDAFQESLNKMTNDIPGLSDFSPVITPVLDLTKVQRASRNLDQLMAVSAITPQVSLAQARLISTTAELDSRIPVEAVNTGPSEVKFEQNIYSPTALSINDIYRNTKSQIVLAKEELGIS